MQLSPERWYKKTSSSEDSSLFHDNSRCHQCRIAIPLSGDVYLFSFSKSLLSLGLSLFLGFALLEERLWSEDFFRRHGNGDEVVVGEIRSV